MKLIENASTKFELHRREATVLHLPMLNMAVRERAASAINEPRFREFSRDRQEPLVAETIARTGTGADAPPIGNARLQSILLAFCSMCFGAILSFAYLGGPREPNAIHVASAPVTQETVPSVSAHVPGMGARTGNIVTVADAGAGVKEMVMQWAAAWSGRDVDRYLAFYSATFVPPDTSTRKSWENKRKIRILGKQHISVVIEDLRVELLDGNRAIAQFAQSYEADNYREARATKILVLAREGEAWRIAAEMNPQDAASRIPR